MAQAFTLQNRNSRKKYRVIVSNEDAHWLRAYHYYVMAHGNSNNKQVVRPGGSHNVFKYLRDDLFPKGESCIHINGDNLDFRRSNVVFMSKKEAMQYAKLNRRLDSMTAHRKLEEMREQRELESQ